MMSSEKNVRAEHRYTSVVQSVAMSKAPKQSGIIFSIGKSSYFNEDNVLKINAINPKTDTETSYLEMQVPLEDLDKVIEALVHIKNNI